MQIWNRLTKLEERFRKSFGLSIDTKRERFGTQVHAQVFDHAYLRYFWTNFHQVAPGVYRSNQPGPGRIERYAKKGIKSILNLRGQDGAAPLLFEQEACDKYEITLYSSKLRARRAVSSGHILRVIALMREMEKPFVFHCKSGADRAGLAAVIYLLVIEKRSLEEAIGQLSWRFLHLSFTATGIQDYIMDVFRDRQALGDAIDFEAWIADEYDHRVINKGFDQRISPQDMARKLWKQK